MSKASQDPRVMVERLRREHQRLDERIQSLDRCVYLSPAEQVERKRLQKLKLVKKDQMLRLGVAGI
ncbi:MAG: YdcH family protein [Myxococcota bacterium]